jgi:hypothetical protein
MTTTRRMDPSMVHQNANNGRRMTSLGMRLGHPQNKNVGRKDSSAARGIVTTKMAGK